jgi:hypothetical protein
MRYDFDDLPQPFKKKLYFFIREYLPMIENKCLAKDRFRFGYSTEHVHMCARFISVLITLDIVEIDSL